jgi:ribonucleotide reductase beta subunit family protein with ferritin-like domain
MYLNKKHYRKELGMAKKDLDSYATMSEKMKNIIMRLEKRLVKIDQKDKNILHKTMIYQITNGIDKAAVTKRALDEQVAYMQHIVLAIKKHRHVFIGKGK